MQSCPLAEKKGLRSPLLGPHAQWQAWLVGTSGWGIPKAPERWQPSFTCPCPSHRASGGSPWMRLTGQAALPGT